MMKDLTNYEMQELLPDYAFGRLSPELKSDFEYNLSKYPDIEEELKNVQAVFSRLSATDIESLFNKKTRNLSIGVNSRLSKRYKNSNLGFSLRFAFPAIAVFLIGIGFYWLFMGNTKYNRNSDTVLNTNNKIELFSEKDMKLLVDSSTTFQELTELADQVSANVTNYQNDMSQFNEQALETVSLNLMSENVMNKMDKASDVSSTDNFSSYYSFLDDASDIGEENFQYILKEIQDANFEN